MNCLVAFSFPSLGLGINNNKPFKGLVRQVGKLILMLCENIILQSAAQPSENHDTFCSDTIVSGCPRNICEHMAHLGNICRQWSLNSSLLLQAAKLAQGVTIAFSAMLQEFSRTYGSRTLQAIGNEVGTNKRAHIWRTRGMILTVSFYEMNATDQNLTLKGR